MSSNIPSRERISVIAVCIMAVMCMLSCEEHLIQRATADYFQYEPGNWWQLIGEADTLFIEIELSDSILQEEVIPVSYNGIGHFVFEADEAVYEYVSVVYTFSGSEYLVIDDFIEKLELPLIAGNTWEDSLIGSIEVSGQQIVACYNLTGSITGCQYHETYDGDVYTIEIQSALRIETPDTLIIDSLSILESYAPGVGIIRFRNEHDDYMLTDFQVQ